MFDVTKFSASGSQMQSLVKDYETFETYQPTLQDIHVSWVDTLNVTLLMLGFLTPIAVVLWWHGFSCLGVVAVVFIATGAMALRRYDCTTKDLFGRQRFATGKVSWEKNQSSSVAKQNAAVSFVKQSSSGQDVQFDVIKSQVLAADQLSVMAAAVLSEKKFNQDIVCRAAQISASDYGRLATEMVEQGIIALKGTTVKQGYNVTKRGFFCLDQLARLSTPLLQEYALNQAE